MKTHIILNELGQPMETCEYDPGKRVLANGARAETFTRLAARRIIKRTAEYAEENNLPWRVGRYRTMRIC